MCKKFRVMCKKRPSEGGGWPKKLEVEVAKKIPKRNVGRCVWCLTRCRGRRRKRSKSGHGSYNEPTAWNPRRVPPFECRLVESAFSAQTSVRTKNKELICLTIPALSSTLSIITLKYSGSQQQWNDWLVTFEWFVLQQFKKLSSTLFGNCTFDN